MGKMKNRTQKQKETHDLAVKLRKLSDEQLVERLTAALTAADTNPPNKVENFLRELEAEKPRGIGEVTLKKIGEFAKEKGYI